MNCPICSEQSLKQEVYEDIEIDTCPKCSGTWLDQAGLNLIIDNKETKFDPDLIIETISKAKEGIAIEENAKKINCPVCNSPLSKRNYDYSSGIIIDVCSKHGIWLDKDELDKVQIHREYWDSNETEEIQGKQGKINLLLKKIKDLYIKK